MLLTSHSLAIADRIATQVLVLRGGKLVWDSSLQDTADSLETLYFRLTGQPQSEDLAWLGSGRS